MRIKRYAAVFVMAAALVRAETQPDPWRSDGMRNGRFWRAMNVEQKTLYLLGFQEGAVMLLRDAGKRGADVQAVANDFFTPSSATFGDLREQLDRLYDDSANLNIPINEVYTVVIARFKGASPNTVHLVNILRYSVSRGGCEMARTVAGLPAGSRITITSAWG